MPTLATNSYLEHRLTKYMKICEASDVQFYSYFHLSASDLMKTIKLFYFLLIYYHVEVLFLPFARIANLTA